MGPLWLEVLNGTEEFSTFLTLLTSIEPFGLTGNLTQCEFLNGSDPGAERDCNIYNIVRPDLVYFNYSTVLAPTNEAFEEIFDSLNISLEAIVSPEDPLSNETLSLRQSVADVLSVHFLRDESYNISQLLDIVDEQESPLLPTTLQLALNPGPVTDYPELFINFTSLGVSAGPNDTVVFTPFNSNASATTINELSDEFACQFPPSDVNANILSVFIHGIDSVLLPNSPDVVE